jgi:hypothetical protein
VRIRVSGTAQLVRRVGDEAALPGLGLLDASEHVVHRRRQPSDLVVG